jgi:hypothetical protein
VQENCIELVGRIADRGAEYVSAREWMRICFELLELLKAHKKSIRRASVNTFGYIAKAIGPHDVLATLLNNLKVQERQNRICTTVAIAIVAETCAPFTVIPALMNEYRVPDLNVQHGVLKALSFMFEYVGEMAKDYIYAVTPLLTDALQERYVCVCARTLTVAQRFGTSTNGTRGDFPHCSRLPGLRYGRRTMPSAEPLLAKRVRSERARHSTVYLHDGRHACVTGTSTFAAILAAGMCMVYCEWHV